MKFGKTYLKLGEMSYLFISYHIIISWLYTLNGFRILFSLRDSATQEYKWGITKFWPHSRDVKTSTRIAIIYLFIFSNKEFEGKKLESLHRARIQEFAYFRSREDIATPIVTAPLFFGVTCQTTGEPLWRPQNHTVPRRFKIACLQALLSLFLTVSCASRLQIVTTVIHASA